MVPASIISKVVHVSFSACFHNRLHFSAEIEDEEIDELESISDSEDAVIGSQLTDVKEVPRISWLLQVVLNNLGVPQRVTTVTNGW